MLAAVEDKRIRAIFQRSLARANSQSQRERIRWMAERALDVVDMWKLDVKELCGEIADTRNWLTYWGKREKRVQEGAGLVRLLRRLDVIISINLMLDLGLGKEVVARQVASGLRLGTDSHDGPRMELARHTFGQLFRGSGDAAFQCEAAAEPGCPLQA